MMEPSNVFEFILTDKKTYQCKLCHKIIKHKRSLNRHAVVHSNTKSYQCNLCNKSFAFKENLFRHKRIHDKEKPFLCNYCDQRFVFEVDLTKHKLSHTCVKSFSCELCPKSFFHKYQWSKHMLSHSSKVKEKRHVCNVCNKSFILKRSLRLHAVIHTGEKPYPCHLCDKKFGRKDYLSKHHSNVHVNDRPYVCSLCNRSFKAKDKFKSHKCHCDICSLCCKSFTCKSALAKHMKIHQTGKPFFCNICFRGFKDKRCYTLHVKNHTGERPYSFCYMCKRSFTSKHWLANHVCKRFKKKSKTYHSLVKNETADNQTAANLLKQKHGNNMLDEKKIVATSNFLDSSDKLLLAAKHIGEDQNSYVSFEQTVQDSSNCAEKNIVVPNAQESFSSQPFLDPVKNKSDSNICSQSNVMLMHSLNNSNNQGSVNVINKTPTASSYNKSIPLFTLNSSKIGLVSDIIKKIVYNKLETNKKSTVALERNRSNEIPIANICDETVKCSATSDNTDKQELINTEKISFFTSLDKSVNSMENLSSNEKADLGNDLNNITSIDPNEKSVNAQDINIKKEVVDHIEEEPYVACDSSVDTSNSTDKLEPINEVLSVNINEKNIIYTVAQESNGEQEVADHTEEKTLVACDTIISSVDTFSTDKLGSENVVNEPSTNLNEGSAMCTDTLDNNDDQKAANYFEERSFVTDDKITSSADTLSSEDRLKPDIVISEVFSTKLNERSTMCADIQDNNNKKAADRIEEKSFVINDEIDSSADTLSNKEKLEPHDVINDVSCTNLREESANCTDSLDDTCKQGIDKLAKEVPAKCANIQDNNSDFRDKVVKCEDILELAVRINEIPTSNQYEKDLRRLYDKESNTLQKNKRLVFPDRIKNAYDLNDSDKSSIRVYSMHIGSGLSIAMLGQKNSYVNSSCKKKSVVIQKPLSTVNKTCPEQVLKKPCRSKLSDKNFMPIGLFDNNRRQGLSTHVNESTSSSDGNETFANSLNSSGKRPLKKNTIVTPKPLSTVNKSCPEQVLKNTCPNNLSDKNFMPTGIFNNNKKQEFSDHASESTSSSDESETFVDSLNSSSKRPLVECVTGIVNSNNIIKNRHSVNDNKQLSGREKELNDSGLSNKSGNYLNNETKTEKLSLSGCLKTDKAMLNCTATSDSIIEPVLHKSSLVDVKERTCNVCDKVLYDKKSLERHRVVHSGEKPYSCNVCDKRYKRRDNLVRHRYTHNENHNLINRENKLYSCSICNKTFKRKEYLTKHSYTHVDEKSYSCSFCNEHFEYKEELVNHELLHNSAKTQFCTMCPKSFYNREALNKHMLYHTRKKPYPCDVCNKSFPDNKRLSDHRVVHFDERPFSCSLCDRTFKRKCTMRVHWKVVHMQYKPYACDFCSKTFLYEYKLRTHRLVHTREKTFICQVCGKACAFQFLLTKHMKVHTVKQTHSCSACARSFKTRSHLLAHLRVHTGEKPFTCNVCNRSFSRKQRLTQHKCVIH